jgi:hypothetical protein
VEGLLVATAFSNHRRAERRWTLESQAGAPPDGDLADDPLWLGDPLVEALGMTSFPIMCQRAP